MTDYPSISVLIDIHRDTSNTNDYVVVNGEECARVMFVVGTGKGLENKPNYEANYKFAQAVNNQMEKIQRGFTRPIRVKSSGYNQHVSDMCLLIEVGHTANSLDQAKNTAKCIALALSRVLSASA